VVETVLVMDAHDQLEALDWRRVAVVGVVVMVMITATDQMR
jgi:hypothetical protein